MIKRAAWFTTLILSTLAVLLLLWQFREAVGLFILSLGVGAAARPLVDRLTGGRIPRSLGLLLVYIGTLGVTAALLVMIGGTLVAEFGRLSNRFVMFYDRLWTVWPTGTALQQAIVKDLPPPPQLYQAIAGAQGSAFFQTVLGMTLSSLTVVSQFFAILVLSIYWSIDQVHFERLWLSLLPAEQRSKAREIWRDIDAGVGSYIRSEVTQSILAGILLGIGFSLIGLDYPVLLAIFGAIAWLVPWLGAILALTPVVLTGLSVGPVVAVGAGLYTIAVLLFLEWVVEPKLHLRRKYSSLLTILIMIALADVMGLVGLVLAPPLAAAIQILFTRLVVNQVAETPTGRAHEIAELRTRLNSVRNLAADKNQPLTPQVQSLIDRLDTLIHEATGEVVEERAIPATSETATRSPTS